MCERYHAAIMGGLPVGGMQDCVASLTENTAAPAFLTSHLAEGNFHHKTTPASACNVNHPYTVPHTIVASLYALF